MLGLFGHLSVGLAGGLGQRERAGAILAELPARPGQREPGLGHQLGVRLGLLADAERPLQDRRRLARAVFEEQGLAERGQRVGGPGMVGADPLRRQIGCQTQVALRFRVAAQELVRFAAVSERKRHWGLLLP